MVFGVQKPPFCNAKRGFLRIAKYPAYTAQNIYRVQNVWQQTPTYGLFIIQNVYQRTHRNIHFLRKYIATCTPQGVGADSSRPFFNPNQMVLICRNDAKRNAIS